MSPETRRRMIRLGVALGAGLGVFLAGQMSHAAPFDANRNEARVIGHRPAGCPVGLWCGCGLARYLGLTDKRLNRAWSWALLFPRTHAKEGAAAVRAHHVMLLEQHVKGTKWLARDFNGGKGLAWLHVRDVRGYVFVDPSTKLGALQ